MGLSMIEAGTVFVLGAGASAPYGFPLGHDLRQQIVRMLSNLSGEEYKMLLSCGHNEKYVDGFRNDLDDAIHGTIDDFISDRPKYRVIASQAICIALAKCENHSKIFRHRDWYPYLFELLNVRDGSSMLNGIITLNYDRSLEHYLSRSIAVSFEGQNLQRAQALLDKFPICHLHGTLGEYPQRPYHNKIETAEIIKMAEVLRITSDDDLDNSPQYKAARQMCDSAKEIIFLGFGYHERVIRRLGVHNITSNIKLRGTAHNLTPKKKDVEAIFKTKIELDNNGYLISDYFKIVIIG